MVWVLTGFMGCGKSSISRLAQEFAAGRNTDEILPGQLFSEGAGRKTRENLPAELVFIDLDEEIVRRAGRSIPEIFADGGEAAFRAVERNVLAELLDWSGVLPLREFASLTPPSAKADGPPAFVPRVARPSGAIATPAGKQQLLISLGGGTLTDADSRELVRKNCRCIYLRATVETLAANLRWGDEAASRPMLSGVDLSAPAEALDSLETRISFLMKKRSALYESAADYIIDIDGIPYESVARQILALIANS